MTTLYVPHLGDDLKLTADWQFKLYNEHRNSSLYHDLWHLKPSFDAYLSYHEYEKALDKCVAYDNPSRKLDAYFLKPAIIPAGTVLRVKRIFIRQGMPDYDSMTFTTKLPDAQGKLKSVRFWAKLDDCNRIEFERVVA